MSASNWPSATTEIYLRLLRLAGQPDTRGLLVCQDFSLRRSEAATLFGQLHLIFVYLPLIWVLTEFCLSFCHALSTQRYHTPPYLDMVCVCVLGQKVVCRMLFALSGLHLDYMRRKRGTQDTLMKQTVMLIAWQLTLFFFLDWRYLVVFFGVYVY